MHTMRKRLLEAMLVGALALALSACGGKDFALENSTEIQDRGLIGDGGFVTYEKSLGD